MQWMYPSLQKSLDWYYLNVLVSLRLKLIIKRAVIWLGISKFGSPCVDLITHIFFKEWKENLHSAEQLCRGLMTTRPVRGWHVAAKLPQRRRSLAENLVTITVFFCMLQLIEDIFNNLSVTLLLCPVFLIKAISDTGGLLTFSFI